MELIPYSRFASIFNELIFEESKKDLIIKIAKQPSRYLGFFRPTKPHAKLLQNLLQSHEIKFGDAFEKVIEEYLELLGAEILDKRFINEDSTLHIDQFFMINKKLYFIEQKIRDDHDSTKKRGQMANFEKKLFAVTTKYPTNDVRGIVYFVDGSLRKNSKYYTQELKKISIDYDIPTNLFFGKDLFEFFDVPQFWEEIIAHIQSWKTTIPELPTVNLDLEPLASFDELKNLQPSVYRQLLGNAQILSEIFPVIFPTGDTLRLLSAHFSSHPVPVYNKIAEKINATLQEIYD